MRLARTDLSKICLMGVSVRTNNEREMNPDIAQIPQLISAYHADQVVHAIAHRVTPGVTYVVYTHFDSDEHGDYTCFIGEAVDPLKVEQSDDLDTLQISASTYAKLTAGPGQMPGVVIAAWQRIWAMQPAELGGNRTYRADFEVHDQRAQNTKEAVIDIYLGIE